MKKILIAAFVGITICSEAQTNATESLKENRPKSKLSGAQLRTIYERIDLKRTGGIARRDNTAKGWFVVLNAQTLVPDRDIAGAVKTIDAQVHVQTKMVTVSKCTVESARAEIDRHGGSVGVVIVDSPALPSLLAAPEEAWALVNVATLKEGCDSSTLAARTRREILRAFAFAAGGIHSAQGDFVLQPVRKPSDLDSLKRESYGVMLRKIFPLTLPYYGLTPWYQATYRKACQEGWAPVPTNEYQKAIWDEVHAPPEKPMKISYDKGKQKPVVK